MATGAEREIERGFAMDPVFSPDGPSLYYASNAAGGLDIWRIDLISGAKTRITTDAGLELDPRPSPHGQHLVYLSKAPDTDQVRIRLLVDGTESVLVSDPILAQMHPALSPDGKAIAYSFANAFGWELRL
jgi:TolB protein